MKESVVMEENSQIENDEDFDASPAIETVKEKKIPGIFATSLAVAPVYKNLQNKVNQIRSRNAKLAQS